MMGPDFGPGSIVYTPEAGPLIQRTVMELLLAALVGSAEAPDDRTFVLPHQIIDPDGK